VSAANREPRTFTGLQQLRHAALALFTVGMFGAILAPVGLQAVSDSSRRTAGSDTTNLLGLSFLGPALGVAGGPAVAAVAWLPGFDSSCA
jgi:TctA family transporter